MKLFSYSTLPAYVYLVFDSVIIWGFTSESCSYVLKMVASKNSGRNSDSVNNT